MSDFCSELGCAYIEKSGELLVYDDISSATTDSDDAPSANVESDDASSAPVEGDDLSSTTVESGNTNNIITSKDKYLDSASSMKNEKSYDDLISIQIKEETIDIVDIPVIPPNEMEGSLSSEEINMTLDTEVEVNDKSDCTDINMDDYDQRDDKDAAKQLSEKMDSYDCDELKIAIYQFLNGSNLEVFKSKESENKPITESNEFIELTKDKETPYSCGVCGKEFTAVGGLVIHLRIHTGDQPFACTECGKEFTNRANLRKHTRIHNNDRRYECDICGSKFTLNQNMQSHRLTHTGIKPHSCKICGKSFSRAHHVKRHMETHSQTPEKNHECNVCNKAFTRKENLQAHLKTHSKSLYGCMLCGQYFNGEGRLKYHVRKKHPDEIERFEISGLNDKEYDHKNNDKTCTVNTFIINDSSSIDSYIKTESLESESETN